MTPGGYFIGRHCQAKQGKEEKEEGKGAKKKENEMEMKIT